MTMQNFTICLCPAEGAPVLRISGRATMEVIRNAICNIHNGLLVIGTEGETGDGLVAVQAGAIISFVSKPEPTLETLDMDAPVHTSDCAVHNGPALPVGPCDCGAEG